MEQKSEDSKVALLFGLGFLIIGILMVFGSDLIGMLLSGRNLAFGGLVCGLVFCALGLFSMVLLQVK